MKNIPDWKGLDVIIIGGGPSLNDFPFDTLKQETVIGCNAAFKLGPEICSVLFFGDYKDFFVPFEKELMQFDGPIFTCSRKFQKVPVAWINCLPRKPDGLHDDVIGWGGNTGCAAINFALVAGAKRAYLLGFDLKAEQDKKHWHSEYQVQEKRIRNRPQNYSRFAQGFGALAKDWRERFPEYEIVNVTDDSALDCFPKMSVNDFLDKRSAA